MDFREPLLGGPNNADSASSRRINIRKKSDLNPILDLFSPRRTSDPSPTSVLSFPSQISPLEQTKVYGGGPEFQVGSVPSRPFPTRFSETSTIPSAASIFSRGRDDSSLPINSPRLSGGGGPIFSRGRDDSSLPNNSPRLSGGGGPEFQPGSVPSRPLPTRFSDTSTIPSAGSIFSRGRDDSSLPINSLSGGAALLHRIPEESYDRFVDQESCSSDETEDQERRRASLQSNNSEDEPDLEARSCSLEEGNGYYDEGDESVRGTFGEPFTDDAQEATKEEKDKDDRYSWKSGLAGLLGMVPLLPSMPDFLNPFCDQPDDHFVFEKEYARCHSCKVLHGSDSVPVQEPQNGQNTENIRDYFYPPLPALDSRVEYGEENGQTTPSWSSGGLRELITPSSHSLSSTHSLPNLYSDPSSDDPVEYSLAGASAVPVNVLTIPEHGEALYGPTPDELQHNAEKTGKKVLRRCRTAPMLTGLVNVHPKTKTADSSTHTTGARRQKSASSIVWTATMGLLVYLCLGVMVYTWKREEFRGIQTVGVVDALYFCIVTMCTIGYGDITPITPSAKILSCALVFVGFGFIDALMSGMVTFVLDRQEHLLLTVIEDGHHEMTKNVIMDCKKGRMRIRMKVALAVGSVVCAMSIGALVFHYMEELSWIDSIYVTCISITTVGYGDVSFQTTSGRLFAAVWLLVSTLGVARAFLFLAEARVHSRHRHLAKRVLHRKMTTNDLMAMDLDNDGHISKSEFVVYKLKEMGKIEDSDVVEICQEFDKIDKVNVGKITVAQLVEAEIEERAKTS